MHALRRNVGLKILLFNNEIYGLTKGQYSPTSRLGTVSPSSPTGSVDMPVSPGQFALGSGARFFARAVDADKEGLSEVLQGAHAFDGASLTEIFQNCIVYNKDVFASFTDRKDASKMQLRLKHGEPMLFGDNGEKGIRFNKDTFALEVIEVKSSPEDVLVHDETNEVVARLLIDLQEPVALGILFRKPAQSFECAFYGLHPSKMKRSRSVAEFLRGASAWTVSPENL